jgi:hypothetical protein
MLPVSMLLTILIALQFKDGESGFGIFDKVTVSVTNKLASNDQLGIDCKDKNYDFQFQTLHFGETYTFTFHPSLFGRSLYFCSFSWINGNHYFDIYVQKRDQEGDKMNWIIKDSGPCKIKDGSIDCFQWNPNVVI